MFTKRDTLLALDMDKSDVLDTLQMQTGCFAFVKNDFTKKFVTEWLHYLVMPEHLTLSNSKAKNHKEFWTHKEDQSVFSLLVKKYSIKSYPLPYINSPVDFDILAIEAGYCDESVEMAYVYASWSTDTRKGREHIDGFFRTSLRKPRISLTASYIAKMTHRKQSFLNVSCYTL
jgi:hypothetical protein